MIGVLCYDAFRDHMIGILLQPSLSSRNEQQAAGSCTSAFLLPTLPQSRIMVGTRNHLLSRMKRVVPACVARYSQIADTRIHTSTPLVGLGCWIRDLNFKRNQQIELFLRFVVPKLGGSNFSSISDKGNMLVISAIRDNHTPIQSQNTDTDMGLEAIFLFLLVVHASGNVLGSLIRAFLALLGPTRLAVFCILFDLRPEAFVGCSNLTRNRSCHLRGQTKAGTNLVIRSVLQRDGIAHFSMLISIFDHKIESISICQLGHTELCKLHY